MPRDRVPSAWWAAGLFSLCLVPPLPAQPPAPASQPPEPPPAVSPSPPFPPSPPAPPSSPTPLDLKEEIVVTANLVETPSESVGSSVTVIGREEIERRQEPYVLDLLRTVPGLEINQSGGPGALANAFMRGANSAQRA